MPSIEEIKIILRDRLTKEHYEHSLRTAELAKEMADAYGVDPGKAYLAGILHDYTKSLAPDVMLEEARTCGVNIDRVESINPYLLHAELAAILAHKDLGISDGEVLDAIRKHTFGAVKMSDLDKIIYVADMIEPGRPYASLNALREMAFSDLDTVYRQAYFATVEYLVKTRRLLHPQTLEVWNELISTN
jgi:predicted HD superfamily hydrolase involved in NAD metabolism